MKTKFCSNSTKSKKLSVFIFQEFKQQYLINNDELDLSNYIETNKIGNTVVPLEYKFYDNEYEHCGYLRDKETIYIICRYNGISNKLGDRICVYIPKLKTLGWIYVRSTSFGKRLWKASMMKKR